MIKYAIGIISVLSGGLCIGAMTDFDLVSIIPIMMIFIGGVLLGMNVEEESQ